MQPLTLIFLGPQGCGKGTQIELLKAYLKEKDPTREIVHFEMGKNLRALAETDTFTGHHAKEVLERGDLIPYAISSSTFAQYLMNNIKTGDEHILIDGFPRTATQVPMLDSALVEFYKRENPTVVCTEISDEEAVKRLLARGRHDDNEDAIRQRLSWSRQQTMPNVVWFRNNPIYTVIDILGEKPIDEVQAEIRRHLRLH